MLTELAMLGLACGTISPSTHVAVTNSSAQFRQLRALLILKTQREMRRVKRLRRTLFRTPPIHTPLRITKGRV